MTLFTLEDIDRASQSRGVLPGFDFELESLYRQENIDEQYKILTISWIIGLFLSDSIIISDYFVTGGAFKYYFIGRFLICSPICLLCIYNMRRKNSLYEVFVGMVPLMMTAMLSVLLMLSHGTYRADYLFGDLLVMICGCAISRPRTRYAIPTVLAQYAMYQAVVLLSDIVQPESVIVDSMFGICGVVVALITAYALEQIGRHAFLLSFRVRLLNRELTTLTLLDPLTRLGNRRCYDEVTERFWASSMTTPKLVSFILIDLDYFKSFNDSYGHLAGDFCLLTVARRIGDQMRRERDVAVRFGGEEFLVFLPDTDVSEARHVAERIRLAILDAAIPHPVIAPDAVVSASLGVAIALTNETTPTELILRADRALYATKRHGRNRVWPPVGPGLVHPEPHASAPLPSVAQVA